MRKDDGVGGSGGESLSRYKDKEKDGGLTVFKEERHKRRRLIAVVMVFV